MALCNGKDQSTKSVTKFNQALEENHAKGA